MKIKVVAVRRGYGNCKVVVDYEIHEDGLMVDKGTLCFSQDKWSDENCDAMLRGVLERASLPNPHDISAIRSAWVGKEYAA